MSDLAARAARLPLFAVRADLEAIPAIPLRPGSLAAVLVFRFLSRPLATAIEQALRPGGLLVYETFTVKQRSQGWGPTRDAFLLEEGELAGLFPGLETLAYEEATPNAGRTEAVARLRARRPPLGR